MSASAGRFRIPSGAALAQVVTTLNRFFDSLTGGDGGSGATGPTGPTGPAGSNGTNGSTGATGPAGPTGATGATGSTGGTGTTGATGVGASSGLSTALGSATGSGKVYFCTDLPALYLDDPTAGTWLQFSSEYLPAPAAASSYTVVGTLNLQQFGKTIRAAVPSNANGIGSVALIPASLPATGAWSVSLVVSWSALTTGSFPVVGVVVANGTTGGTSNGWAMIALMEGATTGLVCEALEFTLAGALVGSQLNAAAVQSPIVGGTGRMHFRLINDGAFLHFQVGADGYHWADWYSLATPASLSQYGFVMQNPFTSSNSWSQAFVQSQVLNTSVTQFTVTAATHATPSVITIGTHSVVPGDIVAIQGTVGTTGLNTNGGGVGSTAAGAIVTAVTATTITTTNGNTGTYSSGGKVTILNR